MRVALIHDWLTGMRGGERVLEELCDLFPDATIFTLFHQPGSVSRRLESMPIRVSPLNRIPAVRRRYRDWLPLYPWAISRFDLSGFDLVLSNSHAIAKGVRKPRGSLHICSCLTPMRYIWDMSPDYFRNSGWLDIRRAALGLLKPPLRAWDRTTAARVDHFVANSRHVQQRIERYYGRRADVVYSPVDTIFFTPAQELNPSDFFLVVSALVPYKRVDLAVSAFNRPGRRLIVVGEGPERRNLERLAGPNTIFRGFVPNEELRELYRRCRAVIITGCEDFGLVALEAQACGRPAIAYGAGGSLETVREGETGILFVSQTVGDIEGAVGRFESSLFDPARLRAHAEQFSAERYRQEMQEIIQRHWDQFAGSGRKGEGVPDGAAAVQAPAPHCFMLSTKHPAVRGIAGMAKRAVDVTLALAGLAVISPLLILLAWLIRRESAGPAFYLQRRLGLNGREFTIVKLRTMRSDAEIGRGATWAVDGDPRCTPLGARLRGFGIDELPQLWNVLKGEMSLIGPRPERPEFHAIFKQRFPGYERRLAVRSGITGWAQVHGWRGDTSLKERVRCDLEYVDRWTIWRDLAILARTPLSVLRQRRKGVSPPVRSDDEGSNRAIGQARNSFLPPRGCAPGDSEQRILS